MKRKVIVLLLAVMMLLQLTGCTTALKLLQPGAAENKEAQASHTPEPAYEESIETESEENAATEEDNTEEIAAEEAAETEVIPEVSEEPVEEITEAVPEESSEVSEPLTKEEEVTAWAQAIARTASENSGIPLEVSSEGVGAKMALFIYDAPNGTTLSISYDMELDRPEKISVSVPALEATEEWIALKDGVLSIDFLGFDPAKIEKFYGDCGFRYGSPEDAGEDGITVLVGQVNSSVMMVQWIDE